MTPPECTLLQTGFEITFCDPECLLLTDLLLDVSCGNKTVLGLESGTSFWDSFLLSPLTRWFSGEYIC